MSIESISFCKSAEKWMQMQSLLIFLPCSPNHLKIKRCLQNCTYAGCFCTLAGAIVIIIEMGFAMSGVVFRLTYGRFFPATTCFCCSPFFLVLASLRLSIGSMRILKGSWIFLFEVWSHSDFQRNKNFGHFWGRNDAPNLEYAPKSTKLVNFRPWSYSQK